MSADEWVPVFPVFNWPLVWWKKYFVFIKTTYSSGYSFAYVNTNILRRPRWARKVTERFIVPFNHEIIYVYQTVTKNIEISGKMKCGEIGQRKDWGN